MQSDTDLTLLNIQGAFLLSKTKHEITPQHGNSIEDHRYPRPRPLRRPFCDTWA